MLSPLRGLETTLIHFQIASPVQFMFHSRSLGPSLGPRTYVIMVVGRRPGGLVLEDPVRRPNSLGSSSAAGGRIPSGIFLVENDGKPWLS